VHSVLRHQLPERRMVWARTRQRSPCCREGMNLWRGGEQPPILESQLPTGRMGEQCGHELKPLTSLLCSGDAWRPVTKRPQRQG